MKKIEALELELAARKMVEGTGLEWERVIRWKDPEKDYIYDTGKGWSFECPREQYELALDVLEGKPVWEGDIVYTCDGRRITATKDNVAYEGRFGYELSWNPPKPKTVMVELLVEDVKLCASLCLLSPNITEACRKALEGMK